ncbi:Rho guanine nucleotide exchange factor, putative [Entamoeba invadens IP1]|uniref:Rho guanine nucleotide exchange factor, putative n=1 Tax=Entamoeba invadens IP1 TaxID=370355 RepID=L7FN71_ENTIV|nr:Rho guanine nucleotide exchange factor, putative [Entamoeba invadens IP1]ELP87604.1 Rho guanine nucleotide exchange factor, putative [Entamoeba invadens IP1]|eukprot:XP_004254375.1 Rho guanine nucleotide exchange factor, putative [Entamoeba invadens IP1]
MEDAVIIEAYPYQKYSYDTDVNRWTSKRLVTEILKKGQRSLAFRLSHQKITGRQFLQLGLKDREDLRLTPTLSNTLFNEVDAYKKISSINVIQRAIRNYQIMPKKNEHEYRGTVVAEILTTERNYVAGLTHVIEDVKKPIEKTPILTETERKTLFSNIETVCQTNKVFLQDMSKKVHFFNTTTCIGDTFLTFIPFLKVYSEYCSNFRHTTELLPLIKYPHKFSIFYSEMQRKNTTFKTCSMLDLLITPIQRLPRYELLLKDLLKHTEKSHVDYANIKKAYDQIKVVANQVNETSRLSELVEEASGYIDKTLHIPEGVEVLPQGRILVKAVKVNGKGGRKYVVLVFNNALCVLKEQDEDTNSEYYTFKFLSDYTKLALVSDPKNQKNENAVKNLKLKNDEITLITTFKTEEELNSFKELVEKEMDNYKKKKRERSSLSLLD